MKVKIIILLLFYFIILISKNCLAISQTQNLLIRAAISSKSKMVIDRTNITLSNDPEINAKILFDLVNITSKTKTGRVSESTLEASTDLVNNSGDNILLQKTLFPKTNVGTEISWKKTESNFFQGDIWDALILNVNYNYNTAGPYSVIVKYTLVTP
jgi:hypothetical protein